MLMANWWPTHRFVLNFMLYIVQLCFVLFGLRIRNQDFRVCVKHSPSRAVVTDNLSIAITITNIFNLYIDEHVAVIQ